MSKHTPSPWTDKEMIPICNAHRFGLSIGFVNSTNSERIAEGEANARLIAASPDLLEACQAFSRLYGRLWDVTEPSGAGFLSPESVKEYDAIHQLMTVAINKATA